MLTRRSSAPLRLHHWPDHFSIVPPDFEFPSCSIQDAWVLWCLGDQAKGWPPLRKLQASDLAGKPDQVRRISEFQSVNRMIEKVCPTCPTLLTLADAIQVLQRKQLLPSTAAELEQRFCSLSASDVMKMFEEALPGLNISDQTPKGRKRRVSQLSWMTIATQKRRYFQDEQASADAASQLLRM